MTMFFFVNNTKNNVNYKKLVVIELCFAFSVLISLTNFNLIVISI